ncbi:MAG: hypothetical protein HQ559_13020, partial [Lentisphaerae bacterium]|nr:hypothetical protein [Lentisphaerota bacterium]
MNLYGPNNRPIVMHREETRSPGGGRSVQQMVSQLNRWRNNYNPLRNLTIARAVSLLEAGIRGEFADPQWTYMFIEMTNPECLALVERRTSAITEMDYNAKIVSEDKRLRDFDEKLAEDQRESLVAGYNEIGNLYEAIEHLAMATFRMYSHVQAHPDSDGVIRHLEPLDQWNSVRDGLKGPWFWNQEAKQTTADSLGQEAMLDPERDMLIIRERLRHVDRPGLIHTIRSSLCDKDWDGFVEIYGLPNPVIIGPANVPVDKETEYRDAATDVSEGGGGYLPNGADVKYPNETRSQSPFEQRLEWLQKQIILVGT